MSGYGTLTGTPNSEREHLLVLKILSNGTVEEAYNGPGAIAWRHAGKMQKNGQCAISLSKLTKLMATVENPARIPKRKA